jgi:small GTP-binding protein
MLFFAIDINADICSFQVVILGDTFTGKTSLALRFAEGYYRESSRDATVGASFLTKRLTVHGITNKIQIWDTAGQDQFKKLAPMYYKQSSAAIICYDFSSPKTFHALKYWIDEIQRNATHRLVIALCATKCDLVHNPDTSEVEQLALETGSLFFSTSAKDNTNINTVFEKIAERVLEIQRESPGSIKVKLAHVDASTLSPQQSPQPTMHASTPGRNTYKISDYMPAAPLVDEKKDAEDIILDKKESNKAPPKAEADGGCGESYLCGDIPEEIVQRSCVIS